MRKLLLLFFGAVLPLLANAQVENTLFPRHEVKRMPKHIEKHPTSRRIITSDESNSARRSANRARRTPGDEPYAVYEDGVLTFYCDGERDSRSGTMYDIPEAKGDSYETPGWYYRRKSIELVIFDSSFANARPTSTGSWFNECSSLTEIRGIRYLNTSDVVTMDCMFYNCINLESIDVSRFNTSNVTDMRGMFGCDSEYESKLTYLDVSGFDTREVKDMSWMFWNSINLVNLDVNGFNTSNVTDMEAMFGCWKGPSKLTKLDVSGFDTRKVKNMSIMFQYLSNITDIDVSGFNTSNVTDMSYMFWGCSGLTSLDVSNFNTSKVTKMQEMFMECSSLTDLDVSHFDTSNVTDMNSMFAGCLEIKNLDVSNFCTSKVTDMNNMFGACRELTSLDISHFDTSNVNDMGDMFNSCASLTSLDLSHFDTSNVTNMSYMFWANDNIDALDLTSFDTSKVENMHGMFGLSNFIELNLQNFDTSNVKDMRAMFTSCSKLSHLNISGFNTAQVTDMSFLFNGCGSLTSLDIGQFNTSNVTTMENMFTSCGLYSIDLTSFDTSKVEDMSFMFYDCSNLSTIFVGETWNLENVNDTRCMFDRCSSLVGGMGTTYDENHTDGEYAHVDGGTNDSGYLTYKEPTQDTPQINLTIKDWDGIMTAFFNSIPNDLGYRLNERSSTGAMRKVYEIKRSHYPNTIMVSDYPPADGTYTYYVSAAYIDSNGEKKGTKSNEVTITFNSNVTDEKPQFGSIVGRVAFSNTSGLELPSVDVDVEFSDGGSKVRVEPNGTFHRDGIPLGKTITLRIADDDCYTYKPVTVVVSKDTQNKVQVIEATAREGVDVSVNSNNYDLRIDNFINAAPEYFEMDVVNTKNQPWTGVVNLIAYKKDDAKKVEQLNNSGVSFSTAKPYYIVGSARVEKLSTGASKHVKIVITDFPTLKKEEFYKFYFVSKRNEESMSLSYKIMSFSNKDLHNPLDVYMTKKEPRYKSDKFPEIPDEVDAYLMDIFDTMKEFDKWDGPIGKACEKLADLMKEYERDKDLEGFYGNLPDMLKAYKVDLENAVKDVKDFTDIFEKARKFYNQVKDTYNFVTSDKTKKDEVTTFVTICKKIVELSGDPFSKVYCYYLEVLDKAAEKILEMQEKLVDAQIDDIFNNNQITFKLKVAHKKEWYDYVQLTTRYYSPADIDKRIKDIEIHMVTVAPKGSPEETQKNYSKSPGSGIESWASYYIDSCEGDAVVLKRDNSRSSICENIDYAMVRFWMKIRWKNERVSTIPLYRDCAKWDVDGQGLNTVITTTLESTTYNMDDKIYLKY